ncbi:MAG: hypothetical protein M5U12_21690 [Verrucomicrobia bacterium]|nr:hypothetical protein [Verrucomicrobiota bacterium]
MASADRTRLTYRLELQRAVPHGVLESAGSTFLLLIALRYFHAGAMAKALVASGGSVGLMLAPVVVSQVARRGWPAAQAAARFAAFGAAVFVGMALVPWLPLYVVGCILAMTAATSVIPPDDADLPGQLPRGPAREALCAHGHAADRGACGLQRGGRTVA